VIYALEHVQQAAQRFTSNSGATTSTTHSAELNISTDTIAGTTVYYEVEALDENGVVLASSGEDFFVIPEGVLISSVGGEVSSEDDSASATIEEGTFEEVVTVNFETSPETISLSPGESGQDEGAPKRLSAVYKLTVKTLSGEEIEEFNKPITISIKTSPQALEGIEGGSIAIERRSEGATWSELKTTKTTGDVVDKLTFETRTTKSGEFAVFGEEEYIAPVEKGVSPKIITPNGDGYNDLAYFYITNKSPEQIRVQVYDLAGSLIRESLPYDKAGPYWDAKDASGRTAEDGAYIYQLEAEGERYSGTIGVAR